MKLWRIWLVFAVCVSLVGGAMGFVCLTLLRLDRDQLQTRERARIEELARLSLYRMDSLLFPILAVESKRPYFEYSATYAANGAYANLFKEPNQSDIEVASPLLRILPNYLKVHFQVSQVASITSPQVPDTAKRKALIDGGIVTAERIALCESRLAELARVLKADPRWTSMFDGSRFEIAARPPDAQTAPEPPDDSAVDAVEYAQNIAEYRKRQQNRDETQRNAALMDPTWQLAGTPAVVLDEFQPAWVGRELLLVRRVRVNGETYVQGCWLDWDVVRRDLLARVRDLLPEAKLVPLPNATERAPVEHQLAALPVALIPGRITRGSSATSSPLLFSLSIAVGSALVAAIAVALLLHVMISFSERRAAFVSTVTHELRTPLTSLRLMSDLLLQGRTEDPAKRRRYLETLQREASRLSHLVENVLAYSRLEADRGERRRESIQLGVLLDRVLDRCRERAQRSGMELVTAIDPELNASTVEADPAAVEQILFNLVDNACKYAGAADDRRIEVSAQSTDKGVVVRVRDFGPGVALTEQPRLFRAFQRSRKGEVRGVPGVGLGLALSRRLARAMGGELFHDCAIDRGAAFLLRLPTA